MGLQPFGAGQRGCHLRQMVGARGRRLNQAAALLEVIDPQRRREAWRTHGGQHVAGSGAVVAQRLAAPAAHEDRPRMADVGQQPIHIAHRQLQVLGCHAVHQLGRLLHRAHMDERTPIRQRLADDRTTRLAGQQAGNGLGHRVQEGGVRGNEDGLCHLVVLGLREQVHRHPVGRHRTIRHHQDLGRAGNHVDADGPEHPALGLGHIGIAGTDDLVHRTDGAGAMGQRRHRLRTADGVDLLDAGQTGRGQHGRVAHAVGRGHHHHQFLHARHLGGNGIHQHRRRIGRLAAGHVEPHPIQRQHALPQPGAIGLGVHPGRRPLMLVITADALGRPLQRLTLKSRQPVQRRLQFALRQPQPRRLVDLQPVKAPGVVHQRLVAARLHVRQNG